MNGIKYEKMYTVNLIIGAFAMLLLIIIRVMLVGLLKVMGLFGKVFLSIWVFLFNRDAELARAMRNVAKFINLDYDDEI